MSYTTIMRLYPGEKVVHDLELSNSYGFGPYVWDSMSQKWLGKEHCLWSDATSDKFWALWKKKTVPMHQRTVLMMTYDRAHVSRADYPQAMEDIVAFLVDFPSNPNHANHWQSIADYFSLIPDCPAIGFHATSSVENPFLGQWNKKKEEHDPIDWNTTYDLYTILRTGG